VWEAFLWGAFASASLYIGELLAGPLEHRRRSRASRRTARASPSPMMPEAFEHGGKSVGLLTVLGYLVAAVLSVAS
jgi:hypothetical protein